MKSKLLSILMQNTSYNSEVEDNYYSESIDPEYESSPVPVVNVITTTKSQSFVLICSGFFRQIISEDLL